MEPALGDGLFAASVEAPPGVVAGSNSLSGTFVAYTPQTLMTAAPVTPSLGSCYATESLVSPNPALPAPGDALNAGAMLQGTGPGVSLVASLVSPGSYFGNATNADLLAGSYSVAGSGGSDISPFQVSFTLPAAGQWTNSSDYTSPSVLTGRPLTFRWTGGAPNTYVKIQVSSAGVTLATSITCTAAASIGNFTVPDYLTRLLVQGEGAMSLEFANMPSPFSASGLDLGVLTAGTSSVMAVNFQTPAAQ